jgi:hypothetical protein
LQPDTPWTAPLPADLLGGDTFAPKIDEKS